jgi:II/X family phage/plasmid replication protein
LQGHNVYGGSSLRQGIAEMLGSLAVARPDVYADLEVGLTQVTNLDVTYSARYASPDEPNAQHLGRELISYLRTLSAGQLKARGVGYDTTTYWGSVDSQLGFVKAYLKFDEFMKQLKDVKQAAKRGDPLSKRMFSVMSNVDLQEWAKCLLRLEASFKKDWLRRAGLPLNAWHLMKYQEDLQAQGRCFLREIWQKKTAPLFAACEGQTMKILDDEEIKRAIRAHHFRETKSGAISYSYADDLFRFYLDIKHRGYVIVRSQAKDSNSGIVRFNRYVADLKEAGIAKATLQAFGLNHTPTVVPILRFFDVDFNSQHPLGWVEPISQFYVGHPALSLVA